MDHRQESMRHVPILLATLALTSLNACALPTETEEPTIQVQVQGTVTAADDGSHVTATRTTWGFLWPGSRSARGSSYTDSLGHYSFSFTERERCSALSITAGAPGFLNAGGVSVVRKRSKPSIFSSGKSH